MGIRKNRKNNQRHKPPEEVWLSTADWQQDQQYLRLPAGHPMPEDQLLKLYQSK